MRRPFVRIGRKKRLGFAIALNRHRPDIPAPRGISTETDPRGGDACTCMYTGRMRTTIELDLLAALSTLPLDEAAADEAAAIRRTLELAGTAIGMGDSLIAGIVRLHGATLLTRNRRHFDKVEGLQLAVLAPSAESCCQP